MTRVLLANLPCDLRETMFPLELASIAAVLREEGLEPAGFDFGVQAASAWPAAAANSDAIVGWASSDNWQRLRAILDRLEPQSDRLMIVAGPHATLFPEDVLGEPNVDAVVLGEADRAIAQAIRVWKDRGNSAIPGVVWQPRWSEQGLASNRQPQRIERLDDLPAPDRTVFRIDDYSGMLTRLARYTQVRTSRGTARTSTFSPLGRLLPGGRFARSVDHVMEELLHLYHDHGIEEFHFEDDAFFDDGNYVSRLCECFRRELPAVLWQCPNGNHPHDLDARMLKDLATAGCYRVYLQLHSPHAEAMNLLGWPWDATHVKRLAEQSRRVGVELGGYFTLGLPNESLDAMRATIEFALESGLHWAQFTPLHFVPGSQLEERKGELLPLRPPEPAIRRTARRAYRRFYLARGRWRVGLRNVHHRNVGKILRRAVDKLVRGRH